MRLSRLLIALALLLMITAGCEKKYVPKPRGYERIDMPKKAYTRVKSDCNFSMEIPVYANLHADEHPLAEKCWFNLDYTPFSATLHLSYKPIQSRSDLFKMVEDSRLLVYKHSSRADEIYETLIGNQYLNGMLYELNGNTATNFQFYVTDSTHHYLRGSLYFNVRTNPDSVAPVLDFIKKDVITMLESLRWE